MKKFYPKVCLRSLQRRDMVQIFRWRSDRQVLHMMGRDPNMPRSERKFVEKLERQLVSPLARRFFQGIATRDGELLGYVSISTVDRVHRSAEFSILIGPKSLWGRGFGTSAAQLFLKGVFQETSLEHLYVYIAHFNRRALRCFQNCGFQVVADYHPPQEDSAYREIQLVISKEDYFIRNASWNRWIRETEE